MRVVQPSTAWQRAAHARGPQLLKSRDFTDLSDAAIAVLLDAAASFPERQTEIAMAHLGGAMARVPADATVFPQRQAHFTMNLHPAGPSRTRTRPASPGPGTSSTPPAPTGRAAST